MESIYIPLSEVLAMVAGTCADCQEIIRQNIARSQATAHQAASRRLGAVMAEAEIEFKVSSSEILHGGQHKELVRVRRAIATRARKQGFSYPQIAGLLQMHHTSVMHLVGARNKKA